MFCHGSKQWRIGVLGEFGGSGWNRLKWILSYYLVQIQLKLFSFIVVIFVHFVAKIFNSCSPGWGDMPPNIYPKKIRPVSRHGVGFVWYLWRISFICCPNESVFATVYGLFWLIRAFRLCGGIPVCIPPAAFQLKWAGGENFPGFFFALGALNDFGSHGNEVFGNVSVFAFKFINRHVHPPAVLLIRVSDTVFWVFGF